MSDVPCRKCGEVVRGYMQYLEGENVEYCYNCSEPKTVEGKALQSHSEIASLQRDLTELKQQLSMCIAAVDSVTVSLEYNLPKVLTLRQVLQEGGIIRLLTDKAFYKLTKSGDLDVLTKEEGWSEAIYSLESLGILILRGGAWELVNDSAEELALAHVSDL